MYTEGEGLIIKYIGEKRYPSPFQMATLLPNDSESITDSTTKSSEYKPKQPRSLYKKPIIIYESKQLPRAR